MDTGNLWWYKHDTTQMYKMLSTCYLTQDAAMSVRIKSTYNIDNIKDLLVEDVINGYCRPRCFDRFTEWNLNSPEDIYMCEQYTRRE